jgi:hypothetical protein
MHVATPTPASCSRCPAWARPDLVRHGLDRFNRLAACMVEEGPNPGRGLQIRLAERLATIRPIEVRGFAGVAARHIRATLLDFARHTSSASDEYREWVRIHQNVGSLPEGQRELFDLLLYWGMAESEVAALLGTSVSGARVCWDQARLALEQVLRRERGQSL